MSFNEMDEFVGLSDIVESISEMVRPGDMFGPGDTTERLRPWLQQEGVSEAPILPAASSLAGSIIVPAELEALHKQALPLENPQDYGIHSGNLPRGLLRQKRQVIETSFTFKKSLNEWRRYLHNINFWVDGYLNTPAYRQLERKLVAYPYLQWNVGVGATACFARAISSIAQNAIIRRRGPFDLVIEVDMKHEAILGTTSLDINGKLAFKVAEQLGLLDQNFPRLKADMEEQWYYTYGIMENDESFVSSLMYLAGLLIPQIIEILTTKKYLAVVENLNEPIETNMLVGNPRVKLLFCFPAPQWKKSFWLISATSQDVYHWSKLPYPCLVESYSGDDMVILTLYSLHQAVKYILGAIRGDKDEQYWHHVAVRCFHYATMVLVPHCSSPHGDGGQQSSAGLANITSDELIRQWAAQGILIINKERMGEATGSSSGGKYSDIYQVGNVILEAFQEYSLLPQLPLSPATTEAEEAMKSAAHFLACHNLTMEHHTTDELCDESEHPARLEHMQWILHVGDGDQGWNLSREWLSDGASGPTTLSLRHCSQQSRLLAMLDHLLAKLPCLCVLDLSYSSVESLSPSVSCLQRLQLLYLSHTPLKSLPPSIFCLQKLQFLSLRGCYNMTSPFGFFSDTTDIITTLFPPGSNNSNTQIFGSLLHLDLSYSNVKAFQCDFFHRMPNLQELLLLRCSNLDELPPSTAALSSLEKLELSGTQIKSFPMKMFFAPAGLCSKASGLTDLHIEGFESITEVEVTLEGHTTLRSFSFIGAPHVKRLSLRGCTKLEYVDIKEVRALEEFDLSATAIKEIPDSIPNLPHLRRLLLMGVSSLRRFPWHKLERLPDVFCLDQCSSNTTITNHLDHPQDAQVCISDSRLFYSFNYNTIKLVRAGKLLKAFYVQVTSCKATTRKMQDGEDMVTTNTPDVAPAAYDDVNRWYLTVGFSMVSMDDVPPFQEAVRHVEISTADRYPHGMEYLLKVTKSISMWDDTHVSCLNDLSDNLDELEECMLRWCHKTVHVFASDKILNLKNAYVSHLKSLTHFHWGSSSSSCFSSLKHLVLEDCPRLECVMQEYAMLPSLETLDILFCYNLKQVFYDSRHSSSRNNYQLPCLRRIRLQELPLLEHIYVDNPILTAPKWEELHVRGCWSLRRLPHLRRQPDKKAAVKVSGERAWWAKLIWATLPSHRDSYEPWLPPEFASHCERVIIKSYLR